jgi:phosphoglycolate phosphatase-like HAD superfamily hydrolase
MARSSEASPCLALLGRNDTRGFPVSRGRPPAVVLAQYPQLTAALGDADRVVFDLDGTLYDTRDFERPALAAVAQWLRAKSGQPLSDLTLDFWVRREAERHRPGLFDDLLAAHGMPAAWGAECLRRFHEHPGRELMHADSLKGYLLGLRAAGRRLALVSNGLDALQRRKSETLGLGGIFDMCVYCCAKFPERQKPSSWAWGELAEWRGVEPTIYVGDDPVDEQFAASGNARFVHFRFRSPKYAD